MMYKNIFLTVLMALLIPVNSYSGSPETVQRFEMFLQRGGLYHFYSIPLQIRSVPGHPDDGYLGGRDSVPIARDDVSMRIWRYGFRYTIGFQLKPLEIQISPALYYLNMLKPGPDSKYRVQQNQYGTNKRGNPYSLRYYQLQEKGVLGIGFSTRVMLNISTPYLEIREDRRFRLTGAIQFDPLGVPLESETGWDRFNVDEKWKDISVGTLREHTISIRLEHNNSELYDESQFYSYLSIDLLWSSFSPNKDFRNMSMITNQKIRITLVIGTSW